MQATTAVCEAGGMGRSPLSKLAAYRSELATKVSVLLTVPPGELIWYRRNRIHSHRNLILTCQTRITGLTRELGVYREVGSSMSPRNQVDRGSRASRR